MVSRKATLAMCTNLGDDVSLEGGVPCGFVRQIGGHEIDESLNLMYHSVHVGHLHPVPDRRHSARPNHPVDFFMKFLCQDTNELSLKGWL